MYSGRQIPSSKTAFVRALCLAGLSVPLFSTPASAGEWTITPRVDLEQSVTDNARSASKGLEADLITTVTAGLDLNGRGRRAQVNLNVNLSRDIFWDNTDLNGVRQSLLGDANVEAVEDFVFIDTRASVTQQSLQRGGGISASDRNVGTADQSTVVNYSIAPDFKHRYGNWADSDLRYTFNETRFFDSDVGSATAQPGASRSHEIRALVRSGPRFTTLTWELSSSRTFTNNSSNRDTTELSGEYAWNRHVTLLGRVGRETIDNSGINSDNSAEFFWRGGVRLRPGPRTTMRFEVGRRFNSRNFSGDASYRIGAQTTVTASYEEEVQTDRQALTANLANLITDPVTGALIDPNTGQPADPNASNFDFLDRVSKRQTFNIALNGTRGRNTFGLNGSVNVRTQEPAGTQDTVINLGGTINRRIWPNLDGGVNASLSATTESASGINDYIVRGGAFLTYRIQNAFTSTLRYSYLRRDSDDNASDLQENVLSVSLRKEF